MMIVKDVSPGLLELFLLNKLFDWLQRSFGFGRGCSGIGCGIIFLCIFLFLACNIVFGTRLAQGVVMKQTFEVSETSKVFLFGLVAAWDWW